MKFVLASQNQHKLAEMQAILSAHGVEVVLQGDLGLHVDVEETGTTFAENALLKARAVMEASGLPAIADDSGVCVDALNGAPGVYSARYGGPGLDDRGPVPAAAGEHAGASSRTAHFTSAIACVFPNGDVIEAEGVCPGSIGFAPVGGGGFGYDPVFFLPQLRKTYAQLTPEEKAAVSHRGKALAAFDEKLRAYPGGGAEVTEVYFVRHAESDDTNHDDLTRGLTEKGLRDRDLVSGYLDDKGITAVLSSPYRRAVETVRPFAEARGLEIGLVEDFRERRVDSGWIEDFDAFCRRQWSDFTYKLSDGEALGEVRKRNIRALGEVLRRYQGQSVAIGGHGTAISTVVNYYDRIPSGSAVSGDQGPDALAGEATFEGEALQNIERIDLFA